MNNHTHQIKIIEGEKLLIKAIHQILRPGKIEKRQERPWANRAEQADNKRAQRMTRKVNREWKREWTRETGLSQAERTCEYCFTSSIRVHFASWKHIYSVVLKSTWYYCFTSVYCRGLSFCNMSYFAWYVVKKHNAVLIFFLTEHRLWACLLKRAKSSKGRLTTFLKIILTIII